MRLFQPNARCSLLLDIPCSQKLTDQVGRRLADTRLSALERSGRVSGPLPPQGRRQLPTHVSHRMLSRLIREADVRCRSTERLCAQGGLERWTRWHAYTFWPKWEDGMVASRPTTRAVSEPRMIEPSQRALRRRSKELRLSAERELSQDADTAGLLFFYAAECALKAAYLDRHQLSDTGETNARARSARSFKHNLVLLIESSGHSCHNGRPVTHRCATKNEDNFCTPGAT